MAERGGSTATGTDLFDDLPFDYVPPGEGVQGGSSGPVQPPQRQPTGAANGKSNVALDPAMH